MRANDSQIDIYVIWINKNKPFNSSNDFQIREKMTQTPKSYYKSYVATLKDLNLDLSFKVDYLEKCD